MCSKTMKLSACGYARICVYVLLKGSGIHKRMMGKYLDPRPIICWAPWSLRALHSVRSMAGENEP